jgi:hypothetical protein
VTASPMNMGKTSTECSTACRVWLWVCIFAAFLVVHTPREALAALSGHLVAFAFNTFGAAQRVLGAESTAQWTVQQALVRAKGILFLISLITLFLPLVGSLRRAEFLWDPRKLTRRLILSTTVFLLLSLLINPFRLHIVHQQYSQMSVSPFDPAWGWYYRRLLMPAIAHFLGFEGEILYYIYSMILTLALIFCVAAYFEYEGIKIGLLQLLSISSSGFIIFNFMVAGWADPMMDILFLLLLFVADNEESRLAVLALSLATHEASAFVLVPMILFVLPRKQMLKYFGVILLYFGLYMLSYRLDALTLMKSQVVLDNKIGFDWAILYPWRTIGGWFLSYKLLWIVILFGIYKMVRTKEVHASLAAVSFALVAPALINVMAVDVYRHVAEGFCGFLICYKYLVQLGYGERLIAKTVMALNIAIPSIYVGTNAGFRFKPGLYLWLCNLVGLQGWLAKM